MSIRADAANIAVIMVGGSGTRLWPLSRADRPKPFLPLLRGRELFSLTLERIADASRHAPFKRVLVVGSTRHEGLLRERIGASKLPVELLLEPEPRNTAAAVAAAAVRASEISRDSVLFVFAADHAIGDHDAFGRDLLKARGLALGGRIVCFGIPPTEPNTGYGYIETPDGQSERVLRFTEKPDSETASRWVKSGRHLWNSGMFVFATVTILDEFRNHAASVLEAATGAVGQGKPDAGALRLAPEPWRAGPAIAVDRAIMEKSDRVAVVRATFSWSDLGTFEQVAKANAGFAEGEAVMLQSQNVHVTPTDRLVVALGLQDIVIADTPDVLMIAAMARSQEVADALALARAGDASLATTTDRPAGINALRRANRARAKAMRKGEAGPPPDATGFGEAAGTRFGRPSADEPANLLDLALRGGPDGEAAAGRFLLRHYDKEDWRPKSSLHVPGMSQTAFRYAWAAALARLFPDRRHPNSEIARKLAAAAETSVIDVATGLAHGSVPAQAGGGFDLATQCWRVEGLAALVAAGFGEFAPALEQAMSALLGLPETRSAGRSFLASELRRAVDAYLDLGDRTAR
jgi:mannose-1-phosphate guanylyltransferase/mannose-6-phosphate isomerase